MSRQSKRDEPAGPSELSGPARSEIILYQTEDGLTRVQLRLHEGTVWLTQRQLAELYQVTVAAISQHILKIFEEGELAPEATIKHVLTVRTEGNRSISRTVEHCAYSVPSQLIGEWVRARIFEDRLEVRFAGELQLACERLRGRNLRRIDYRHVIWSLVRKPGGQGR